MLIKKFNVSGIVCFSHYCKYFDEWVVWSSLPHHSTYYNKDKKTAMNRLVDDIVKYTTTCSG